MPQLSAVGGPARRRDLAGLADTHDELPVGARAALTGAAGVAVGISVAGHLHWPGCSRLSLATLYGTLSLNQLAFWRSGHHGFEPPELGRWADGAPPSRTALDIAAI